MFYIWIFNYLRLFFLFLQELFPQTEVKPYPDWVFGIIILLCVVPVISIPLVAVYRLVCRGIKSPSHADLNPYYNDGFEVETKGESYRRT